MLAAAAALGACDAAPLPVIGAVPAAIRAPGVPALVVQQADAGRAVSLHVGETIEVVLIDSKPVPGSSLTWDASSSNPSVLAPAGARHELAPDAVTGQGRYVADFQAAGAGSTTVVATGTRRCEAMAPSGCSPEQLTFPVTVLT
jgi:hypothetical protein